MMPHFSGDFDQNYQILLKRLKLNGLQSKTIDAYSCVLRLASCVLRLASCVLRLAGERSALQIDALTEQQLTDYSAELLASHSWSTVKLDLRSMCLILR
jgi:integrase/recombinase XerD